MRLLLFVLVLFSPFLWSPYILSPQPNYGAYHWSPDERSWPGTPDRLNWGAEKAGRLGVGTIRVTLSPQDPYQVNPPPIEGQEDYLMRIAATPEYAALFSNPQFTTYLLTTSTPQAYVRAWAGGSLDRSKERAEYRNLAAHLGATYPGKKFILLNWEGDNDLYWFRAYAAEFKELLRARVDGIRDAGQPNVSSGIEMNCAYPGQPFPCDQALVAGMVAELEPDYISYSSWTTINGFETSTDPAALQAALEYSFDRILEAAGISRYWGGRLILGEYGRSRNTRMPADDWFRAIDKALRTRFVAIAIYWQMVEDIDGLGYGAYDADGILTENGLGLQRIAFPQDWFWRRKAQRPVLPRRF